MNKRKAGQEVLTIEERIAAGISGLVVCIVNRKGGVGKSFVASNLAVSMAPAGPVALLDLDLTNRDSTAFAERANITQILLERSRQLEDGTWMAERDEVFEKVVEFQEKGFNVVIDAPPGIGGATDMACMLASMLIIPTRPGFNDIGGLKRIFELVEKVRNSHNPTLPVFTLCNFYRNTREANAMVEWLEEIKTATFLGKVWERTDYSEAIARGQAVWDYAPGTSAAQEMKAICDYLLGQLVELAEVANG